MRIFQFTFFLLATLIFASVSRGENFLFELRSGDRLSGQIISETTNSVVISNSWTKEIIIPLAEISKRQKIAPLITSTAATNIPAISQNSSVITPTPPPATQKPKVQFWHGEAALGTDLGFSEKNRQLYYGRAKVIYARDLSLKNLSIHAFRNTIDYKATYGRTDRVLSANQMDGSIKTDFDLGKKFYVYNAAGAGYDEIRKIDFQFEVGPGVGYHLLTRSNLVLNTEVGFNFQQQYFDNQPSAARFYYRFAEDLKWKISPKLSLDEKLEYFPRAEDVSNYRARFESTLAYTLLSNVFFNFSLLDTYDTQPATGVDRNDLQIRSSIGVKF